MYRSPLGPSYASDKRKQFTAMRLKGHLQTSSGQAPHQRILRVIVDSLDAPTS